MFNSPTRKGFSVTPRVMSNVYQEKMSAPNNAYYVLTQAHAGLPNSSIFNTLGDARYLKLDGSNANSDINIGSYNFTTTGTGTFGASGTPGSLGLEVKGTAELNKAVRIGSSDAPTSILDVIGTTNPVVKIDGEGNNIVGIEVDGASGTKVIRYDDEVATRGANAVLQRARGTQASPAIILNGDRVGYFDARGYDGANFYPVGVISFEVDGTPGTQDMPGRIAFKTQPDGGHSYNPPTRMTIRADGDVRIFNNLKVGDDADPTEALDVEGNAAISGNAVVSGSLTSNDLTVDSSTLVVNPTGYEDKIGMGTLTPDLRLTIDGSSSNSSMALSRFDANKYAPVIKLRKSRSATVGQHTIVQDGDYMGEISFWGSDGTNWKNGATITALVDGTPGTNDMPGRIEFRTLADNTAGVPVNRMTIKNNGNIRILNNLKIGADASPTAVLDVEGDSRIGDSTNYAEIKSDGEINLHGTARVKKSLWLPFEVLKAPGTKPADYVDHGIAGAWSFSDGTDDTVVFLAEVPPDMDKSVAPTLKIGWSTNTTATDETAVWQLEYLWMAPGEDTTAAAQETLTINSNAIAQANGLIIAEFTGIDAPDADDVCIHCRLKRLGADANDDLSDTAELHGVCLSYTSNKLGEAI